MSGFRVGDTEAPRGARVDGHFNSVELVDGTRVQLPMILVNGAQDGPTVFIGGGIHGDEVNGVRAVIDAVKAVDPAGLRGRVLAVPVQNPIAYRNRYRLITLNQLDQQNTHRCFPGNPDGDTSDRICHTILEDVIVAAGCDFIIDCHTGSTGSRYPSLVFVSTQGPEEAARKSVDAAMVFGADLVVKAGGKAGVYALQSMLHMVAVQRGLPAIGCELGTALPAEERYSTAGTNGILNVLAQLGMIAARPVPPKPVVVEKIFEVRVDRAGIVDYLIKPGQPVKEGQVLARVMDIFGKVVAEPVSPITGHVITRTDWGSLNEGDRICRVGMA